MGELTLESRVGDLYRTPVGHDALAKVLLQLNIPEWAITNGLVSGLKLKTVAGLTKKVLGKEFFDAMLKLVNTEKDVPVASKGAITPKWWKEAVCYQIYPKSFVDSNGDGIGDLQGILNKLDYIQDLGIDVIWVCPIYQSPNADNGYDISDYQAIMKDFGTMEDFDRLLSEVHARGMKLIMDLVVNHTSDEHPWFIESKSSPDSPKRDWYIWSDGAEDVLPNNWESIFSGSAWEYDKQSGQYYLHVFAKKQPDLNWENTEMREAVYSMINWWLDKGIDGFRIDAISHIKKKEGFPNAEADDQSQIPGFSFYTNQEGIHDILQELKDRTFSRYDIMTVGEASGVSSENSDPWVNEEIGAFNMVFQFEHLALWEKEAETELDLPAFKAIMNKWQTGLHRKGWNALFIENHDKPRIVSTLSSEAIFSLLMVRFARISCTVLMSVLETTTPMNSMFL